MLDGTRLDFVQEKAGELITDPKLGVVVNVYEHLIEDDNSNFECDVLVDGGTYEERAVPYNGGHSSHVAPPKVGDTVLIVYREGDNTRPILVGSSYTNTDRAPLARAGMYRDVYESGSSPAGAGDIKVTGYTQYDDNPARVDKSELTPQRSWFQISKEQDTPDPSDPQNAPMTIEMFDAPADDEAHVTISLNKANGSDTAGTWGVEFYLKTGGFKIVDSQGYGIVSDGAGNFTWNYESIDYSQGTTDFL